MDLKETFKLLVTLLAISLLVLLCSCNSTRKVQNSTSKESLQVEQSTTEKKDVTTETETQTVINHESNEMEITPIDTSKVLVINGKTYKNAKVKILHRKSNTTIAEKATVKDKTKSETKQATVRNTRTVEKDTEKKSNPFLPLLWLLIPAAIYLIWKYKYNIIGL